MVSNYAVQTPSEECTISASLLCRAVYTNNIPIGFVLCHKETDWSIFLSSDKITAYVIFPGSRTQFDWLINASSVTTAHPVYKNVQVHAGYNSVVNELRDDVRSKLAAVLNANPSIMTIVCGGHSKGGAMSQLFVDWIVTMSHGWLLTSECSISFALALAHHWCFGLRLSILLRLRVPSISTASLSKEILFQ